MALNGAGPWAGKRRTWRRIPLRSEPEPWGKPVRRIVLCCVAVSMLAFAATSMGQEATAPTHVIAKPADLKWGDPPPAFEKGALFTVIAGNPAETGPYVVR